MATLRPDDPVGVAAVDAVQAGDVAGLQGLLIQHPKLATARLERGAAEGAATSGTLLHTVTDWPGHVHNGPATVAVLVEAGADVNARFAGPHTETPLHWAASCDDVAVLDALLDAGADIESPGAVIAGGTPLDDAVAFGQWQAARRLVERGARTSLWHAAALGLVDRIDEHVAGAPLPGPYPWGAGGQEAPPGEVTVAFWCACHGGQRVAAERMLGLGAELDWVSVWDGLTPLDAAERSEATEVAAWLRSRGARTARELGTAGGADEAGGAGAPG
jgi:uncharacterized protein